MALGSVALEIALQFSQKNHDLEVRKLQPYVELARGNAPPTPPVWIIAARNRHWPVVVGSLLVLLTFSFHPLATALFNVQDIDMIQHAMWDNATNMGMLSLNNDQNFQDLTCARPALILLTAAGYASASVLYNISYPPFVYDGYTIAPLNLPYIANGTLFVNTTAVLSHPTCMNADFGSLNMTQWENQNGWNNSATFRGCEFSWSVDKSSTNLFGVDPVANTSQCSVFTSVLESFRPVICWFFTYQPTPMTSLTIYTDAQTLGELGSGNGTDKALAQYAGIITAAYNGMFFDVDLSDLFAAAMSGLTAAFENDQFAGLAEQIYRLFLSPVATHLLAAALFVLAAVGTLLQLWHRRERRALHLSHAPGTIALAVSLGGQTDVGSVLAGRQGDEEVKARTMKIVMEGEEGYDQAVTPGPAHLTFGDTSGPGV
ncbi:uncharacterized protein PHACADRAFT_172233 [Phanerochaete carnosa HHB-10118-sp]|uniref:Uncharacterized protein n=1 Tax=Phanerochaete carnosa (strain HHB-10118-sp) TaxID=650164 RepID=K5WC32_PHACS|nr:uncharacterized protein PHACADRAFT_172233 [Phanerochaete carnosa HHB-10118-sp]EKM56549.1 hypothetical protein PHACADRAFT_172233 [Phanerochaete carnosa HHB-10118-sp]